MKMDRYQAILNCPNPECDQSGLAKWEEPQNPVWHGEEPKRLVSVPSGFTETKDRSVGCNKCGTVAWTLN